MTMGNARARRSGSSTPVAFAGCASSIRPRKIEGVAARMDGDSLKLLLVTDADDAAIPARLFSTTIEAP